jgi:hypothetical protein
MTELWQSVLVSEQQKRPGEKHRVLFDYDGEAPVGRDAYGP